MKQKQPQPINMGDFEPMFVAIGTIALIIGLAFFTMSCLNCTETEVKTRVTIIIASLTVCVGTFLGAWAINITKKGEK